MGWEGIPPPPSREMSPGVHTGPDPLAKGACALWSWDCWVSPEAHLLLGHREQRGQGGERDRERHFVSVSFLCPEISVL